MAVDLNKLIREKQAQNKGKKDKSIPKEISNKFFTEVFNISISRIRENKNQPRETYNEEKIKELAESIEEKGLMQPIIVTPYGKNFMIMAGHRRFRAFKKLKKETIQGIVKEGPFDEGDLTEYGLLENLLRDDLNAYEIAKNLFALNENGKKVEMICKITGYSRTSFFRYKDAYKMIKNGDITKEELIEKGIKNIKSPTVGLSKKNNKTSLKNNKKYTIKVNDFSKKRDVEKAIEKTEKVLSGLKSQLKKIG